MNKPLLSLVASLLAGLSPATAMAQSGDDLPFDPYLDLRYRLEIVDQENLPEDATASTLRVRGGIETDEWSGLSALVEGEAIVRIGPEDFNDTVSGQPLFPVVADPSDVLLNRAFVRWRPHASLEAVAGRQKVNFDNQRWIGSVDWRQNDQTFDLAQITVKPVEGAAIDYVHSWRVNRIFGPDSPQGIWRDTDIHNVHATYTIPLIGTVAAYGYFLDIPDAPAASSQTFGVRLSGAQLVGGKVKFLYAAEYANQRDLGSNPANFSLDYLLIEPGIAVGGFTARAGFERLEGDGAVALQTPLATLHAFNGWADKFLATPPEGLRDLYGDIGFKFGDGSALTGLLLRAIVHDFGATEVDRPYGREWNLLAMYPVSSNITLLAKFAHYDADAFSVDTTKGWLQVQVSF
ncbi:alginate export family protein [Erythrobacter sp.]|uniref:alginate export family protein n=1 Tax=Erythrobacter sp. TaxID=1042 RepID=UPI00311F11A9